MSSESPPTPIATVIPNPPIWNILDPLNSTQPLLVLQDIFSNSLTAESPQASPDLKIKIPLLAHQKAAIEAMNNLEIAGNKGKLVGPDNSQTFFTNMGVLGDNAGTGKSLIVLAQIAANLAKQSQAPQPLILSHLVERSTRGIFSITKNEYLDISSATVIVVPDYIYNQWKANIKNQTTLKPFLCNVKSHLSQETKREAILQSIATTDFILVSNNIFRDFSFFCLRNNIIWKRLYIDEADNIIIQPTTPHCRTGFTWLISSNWPNIVFNKKVWPDLTHYRLSTQYNFHPDVIHWLNTIAITESPDGGIHDEITGRRDIPTRVFPTHFQMYSTKYMEQYSTTHPLRGHFVIRSSDDFIKTSIQSPPILYENIYCSTSTHMNILSRGGLIRQEVISLLNDGNIYGALKTFGVKEITRSGLLDTIQDKSISIITSLKERIDVSGNELCPICLEIPKTVEPNIVVSCCYRLFCGSCILKSMEKNNKCPICRAHLNSENLSLIISERHDVIELPKLPSKIDAIIQYLKDSDKTSQFLIYNINYIKMEEIINKSGVSSEVLCANRKGIMEMIHRFESNETRVLALNSSYNGQGLNMMTATHILFYNPVSLEIEKQIIGKAYRIGRTKPLTVVRFNYRTA